MKKVLFALFVMCSPGTAMAQCVAFNPGGDTTKTVAFEGYADIYFGYDFNQPKDANRPYFVSHHRYNEFNVNLAYLSCKYSTPRVRAVFTPGFGTYMNANYAAERVTLRNIVEASIGIKLLKDKDIWVDVGVIGAPYTTESAISFDQLLYTRSFAAEYSPYYLTGAKFTIPVTNKLNLYLYLVNGWQVIEDINAPLAFGSLVEYKPNDKLSVNWSTYIGNEQSASAPSNRGRYFSDLYFAYSPTSKITFALDVYGGQQKLSDSTAKKSLVNWGQGNVNARYSFNTKNSVSARAEYYSDVHSIFIVPVTGLVGFDCYSYSLCYNHFITKNVLFRVEGRYFQSAGNVFLDNLQRPVSTDALVIGGLTAKF